MWGTTETHPPLSQWSPGGGASVFFAATSEVYFFYTFLLVVFLFAAVPNGDSDGGRALGLALGSDIKITIKIKIKRVNKKNKNKNNKSENNQNKNNQNKNNQIKRLRAHVSTTLYVYSHLGNTIYYLLDFQSLYVVSNSILVHGS